jgi:predicted nucleotidyltransferase
MNLPSYFKDFLGEIEPSPSYKEDQQTGHKTLRRRLATDEDFKPILVNTFLQGSYKRNTAIHPGKDVDIVVVTSLDPNSTTPSVANARLEKCLKKYYDKVERQSRSFGVTLSYVTMDVVLATSRHMKEDAALFEAIRAAEDLAGGRAWADHPLLIPDRDLDRWVETDPKRQLAWTTDMNAQCGGYFVPLVKMFKWWRKEAYAEPKHPKGYVLERLAGECVDRAKRDHAEGFVQLLENISSTYRFYAAAGAVPHLPDPGVPTHNVAGRVSAADFAHFMGKLDEALPTARQALREDDIEKSATLWRKVLGTKFPAASKAKASFPAFPVRPNKPAGFA